MKRSRAHRTPDVHIASHRSECVLHQDSPRCPRTWIQLPATLSDHVVAGASRKHQPRPCHRS
eukprot:4935494-Pleurochrysis_carterae.AAC.2